MYHIQYIYYCCVWSGMICDMVWFDTMIKYDSFPTLILSNSKNVIKYSIITILFVCTMQWWYNSTVSIMYCMWWGNNILLWHEVHAMNCPSYIYQWSYHNIKLWYHQQARGVNEVVYIQEWVQFTVSRVALGGLPALHAIRAGPARHGLIALDEHSPWSTSMRCQAWHLSWSASLYQDGILLPGDRFLPFDEKSGYHNLTTMAWVVPRSSTGACSSGSAKSKGVKISLPDQLILEDFWMWKWINGITERQSDALAVRGFMADPLL